MVIVDPFGSALMFLRRTILMPVILVWAALLPTPAWTSPKTQAAKEAAELMLRKFGKEAAEEGVEKLTTRIETLTLKYGDDVVAAVGKGGPRALRAVEKAGAQGAAATKLLARE